MHRIAAALWAVALSQGADTWTPELSMRYPRADAVVVSPDGSRVAWTQSRAVMEAEKSENLVHIFLARADGSGRIQLTRGEKSCTAPAFSPDGRSLYFASERSGKRNLYRIALEGGEAEQLTDWKGEMGPFRIAPDGRRLAFAGREEDKQAEKRRKEKLDFRIADADPKNFGLFVVPLDGALPAAPAPLHRGAYHVGDFEWSPDGRFIAFDRRPTPAADDAWSNDVAEIEIAGGAVRDVAATPVNESGPRYSPDGRFLAFLKSTTAMPGVEGSRIALFDRSAAAVRTLAATFNESPVPVAWAGDSRSLLFAELRGTRTALLRMPLDAAPRTVAAPERGTLQSIRCDASGERCAAVHQTPEEPGEVHALGAAGRMTRLSDANAGLPRPPLGKTELLKWKAGDGLEIEGLLTYPVGWQPGKPVPMVLNIHGGPAGAFQETFLGAPSPYPIASFAAKGWAVLRANPRGSTGYSAAFRRRVVTDWGGLDYQDLMAGVDRAVAMGVADPQRLAVMGWSYGGYMTAWVVTQTTRFRAAAMGAAIVNHVSMYGTQDVPRLYEEYFGGTPWTKAEVYARSSPINFVARVKTPTLILHGEDDARVPPTQGREFYRALRRQGVETKLVLYPRSQHIVTEPKLTLHVMQQHLEWLERFLR